MIFPVIELRRSDEFRRKAKTLSEFISLLPLNAEQNNRLVEFIIQNVKQGEEDAFKQGFEMGYSFGLDT